MKIRNLISCNYIVVAAGAMANKIRIQQPKFEPSLTIIIYTLMSKLSPILVYRVNDLRLPFRNGSSNNYTFTDASGEHSSGKWWLTFCDGNYSMSMGDVWPHSPLHLI